MDDSREQIYIHRVLVIDCVSGKWKPAILFYLSEKPLRYTELRKLVPAVSQKVLTEQLRELESDGLILREELNYEVPKGTRYSLTKVSKELEYSFRLFHEWGSKQAQKKQIITQKTINP